MNKKTVTPCHPNVSSGTINFGSVPSMNVSRELQSKINGIFDKVLKENSENQILVGGVGSESSKEVFVELDEKSNSVLVQPHNISAYFDFDKSTFKESLTRGHGLVGDWRNHNSEFVVNYLDCTIKIKKSQIQIINMINHKTWSMIPLDESVEDRTLNLGLVKLKECFFVLEKFISNFGGFSNYNVLKFLIQEFKIESEDFIDLQPMKEKFSNKVVSKYYNHKEIELSNPLLAVNYISNQALNKNMPSIVKEFNKLYSYMELHNNFSAWVKKHIFKVEDCFLYPELKNISMDESLLLHEHLSGCQSASW